MTDLALRCLAWLLAPSTTQRLGYALTELELVLRERSSGHL